MSPGERLNVLILEDNPQDAELELHELERAGFKLDARRVETEADYIAALKPGIDLVIADFRLPQFDGMSALRLFKERGLDVPFILVSGAIGEEKAVEAMLQGAFAYVMKSRLVSLAPIVSRALAEAAMRRENIATHLELTKSERRYRRLFESSQDGILILDAPTGVVLDVNPALLALIGYEPGEILGHKLCDVDAFKGLEAVRDLPKLSRLRRDDVILTSKAGARVDVEFVGNIYAVDGGTVIQCAIRDITERKRLQAQFFQAQKMESIGVLAGGIAHDFNNILMTIMACSNFLREGLAKTDPRRADVEEIEAAATRAASLTRQLLIFSRKQVVQPVTLDLNELLRNLQKMLRRLIGEDIDLEILLCAKPAFVRVDPGQMEQVILNLSVNARHAMPKGGRLTLRTQLEDADVRLEVSDTGCGMPPEVLAHLFEPFFTTRPTGKGTGLGLSTVYGIVTQAEGDVHVRSVVGRGSTFTVRLPRSAAVVGPAPCGGAVAVAARGTETILLVEDDENLLRLNERALRAYGYRVLAAHGGEEALVLLKGEGKDAALLLSDVVMAGMSGGELAQKALRLRPDLKVIFVTGYIDHMRVDSIKALKGEVLQKPIAPDVLAQKIREMLDRSKAAVGGA